MGDVSRRFRRAAAPSPGSRAARAFEGEEPNGLDLSQVPLHGEGPRPLPLGAPLPGRFRGAMERAMGTDFSRVRVREASRPRGVLGSTLDEQILLQPGLPRPTVPLVWPLLAHELVHVAQRKREGVGSSPTGDLEAEAGRAAGAALRGARARIAGRAEPGTWLHSTLSAALEAEWNSSHDKGRIFNLLRASSTRGDADARTCLQRIFGAGTDDLWLAEALLDNGPETLWPPALITQRVQHASSGHWAAEPGGIAADLPDPYGAAAPPRVRAYFFPGQTDRRALILGGVHGVEQQGADTVEQIRVALAARSAAGHPPFFTTILVPTLFEVTHRGGRSAGQRHVPGGMGRSTAGVLQTSRSVEPNRNFPLPGEDLAAARARGAGSATASELVFRDDSGTVREAQDTPDTVSGGQIVRRGQGGTSTRMLAENRILIQLIERFQPERLASVHAHSLKTLAGDAPGIFVDPRGIDPVTHAVTNPGQGAEDDRLATALTGEGTRRWAARGGSVPGTSPRTGNPFVGNAAGTSSSTVHYSSTATPEGNSLGTWAPVPTVAGAQGARVSRPGITTVTVEIPQWTDPSQAASLRAIEELDRDLLIEIFLGDPSVTTPATGPTRPPTTP